MARIVYSAGASLKGATEADNVTASFEMVARTTPEVQLPAVSVPGCVLFPYIPQQAYNVAKYTLSGNTKGAYIKSLKPETWKVEDSALQRIARSDLSQRIPYEIGNNFVRRTESVVAVTDTITATAFRPGIYDYNSLPAAATRAVRHGFSGRSPGKASQCVYLDGSSYSMDTPGLTRNPDRVFPTIDLSGVSVASTPYEGSAQCPMILVSPRHAVCNAHLGYGAGQRVMFHRQDGSYQVVNILGTLDSPAADDLRVVILDADVTGCSFAKTLPADWKRYIPASDKDTLDRLGAVGCMPLVVRQFNTGINPSPDQDISKNNPIDSNSPKMRVEWFTLSDTFTTTSPPEGLPPDYGRGAGFTYFNSDDLYKWHNRAYPGDSGSPLYLLVPSSPGSTNFTPALISSHFTAGSGPFYPNRRTWINSAMQQLSTTHSVPGSYTFGTVDISGYPVYD